MKFGIFDVKTAFLKRSLKKDIYIYPPEGFNDNTGRIGKLIKSMYGLKQASKDSEFTKFLEEIGFQNTDDDLCIFYNDDRSTLIVIFVDDGCVIAKSENKILEVLDMLQNRSEITHDGVVQSKFTYLGMQV